MRLPHLTPLLLSTLAAPAAARDLELVLVNEADILPIELGTAGGMAFDSGRDALWVSDGCDPFLCDGAGTGSVFLLDPATGAVLTSFNPGPPGGADGAALSPLTGLLYLWDHNAAVAVDATGAPQFPLVGDWYGAATFTPTLELWAGVIQQGELRSLDPADGQVLATVPVPGLSSLWSLTHDPRTGYLVGLKTVSTRVIEIDLRSASIVGETPIPNDATQTSWPGAIELDADGTRLFYAEPGWGPDATNPENHVLYTFERVVPGEPLCFGDGSGASCPCGNGGGNSTGCANSSGVGARLFDSGSDSASADDLAFMGIDMLPGQPALLFSGTTLAGGGAGVAFGDGLRCADGAVKRLRTTTPDAAGRAAFGSQHGALGGWSAGDTRFFQAYYRDPASSPCGFGFNTTHALRVAFGA